MAGNTPRWLTDSVVRLQTNDRMLTETFWNHYHTVMRQLARAASNEPLQRTQNLPRKSRHF